MSTAADIDTLLKGWRADPAVDEEQLTHAVGRKRHVAVCGVPVTALGEPWPDWSRRSTMPRCSTCTQAVAPRR